MKHYCHKPASQPIFTMGYISMLTSISVHLYSKKSKPQEYLSDFQDWVVSEKTHKGTSEQAEKILAIKQF